jgi:hypothetical protein
MESALQYSNKLLFACVILLIASCGEKSALREVTYFFEEENRDWIVNATSGDNFLMTDSFRITQSFQMNNNSCYFTEGSSGILVFTTKRSFWEYHYQEFISNYGISFSLSLTAGDKPFGDNLYISLANTDFAYDLKHNTISRISTLFGARFKIRTDKGYEDDEPIYSTVELIGSLEIEGSVYKDILHFSFNDFNESWTEFTITDIFVAKQLGLVKYRYNNGIECFRK